MPRIIGRNLLLDRPSAHLDTRFCVTMRLDDERARTRCDPHPERDLSCPATITKTTHPRAAGVMVRRAAKAAPAPDEVLRRSSPSGVWGLRILRASATTTSATGSDALMPGNPMAPDPTARSPIPARASPMVAVVKGVRRAAMGMRRVLAVIARSPIGRSVSNGMIVRRAARAMSGVRLRRARTVAATSAPTPRAGIAVRPAPLRASRKRSSATGSPMRPAIAAT